MSSKKERSRRLTFAGFAIAVFRDREGRVTIDVESSDAQGSDVYPDSGVPRLRVTLNEEDRETTADGGWLPLDAGPPETRRRDFGTIADAQGWDTDSTLEVMMSAWSEGLDVLDYARRVAAAENASAVCPACRSTCWADDPEGGPAFCESCGFIPGAPR